MSRTELEKSWAVTAQHLGAARALLSADPAPGPDGGTLALAASRRFERPDWFGREVTHDARYKNRNLACHGRPA